MDYMISFINENRKARNMKKSDLLKAIDLDFKAGYKYLSGERRLKRNTVIRICVVFDMDFEEVQDLFLKSFYPQLYIGDQRDNIIAEGIKNSQTIAEINNKLMSENLEQI